jgi:outer membrane biogenesis lipoprotein LolB
MTPRILPFLALSALLGGCAMNAGHDTQADGTPKPNLWQRLQQTDDIDAAMERADDRTWNDTKLHGDSWNPN